MQTKPLYAQTRAMLDAVNQLDLPDLRGMVDDRYGIVDVDPQGNSVVLNSKTDWEHYMREQFGAMKAANARLASEILDYHAEVDHEMAYSVVRFRQDVTVDGATTHNTCVATIVWRLTEQGWKEARWHCSLEKRERS